MFKNTSNLAVHIRLPKLMAPWYLLLICKHLLFQHTLTAGFFCHKIVTFLSKLIFELRKLKLKFINCKLWIIYLLFQTFPNCPLIHERWADVQCTLPCEKKTYNYKSDDFHHMQWLYHFWTAYIYINLTIYHFYLIFSN